MGGFLMLSTSFVLKLFGAGVVGAIISIVLKRMGKEDLAVILDIALAVGMLATVTWEIKDYIDQIKMVFGA